jgi:ABC-2 type transport system permease protein
VTPGLSWTAAAAAVRVGVADFKVMYTWRSWTFGWFLRLISQSVFFSSFGLLLHSTAILGYLVIGNSVVLACMEALAVIPIMNGQRDSGVLALEIAAPVGFPLIYLCRNIYCPVIGCLTSTITFFAINSAFGVPLHLPGGALVPFVIFVVSLSTYAFGFALAALVMWAPSLQPVITNVSYLALMTFCGVDVPVSYWPGPIRSIAYVLPLTHGLGAIRGLAAGAPVGLIWRGVLLEGLIGLGWVSAGMIVLTTATYSTRRTGSLELST